MGQPLRLRRLLNHLMLVPVSILLGAGLTVITALAIGRMVLRRIPVDLYRDEENALGFILGSSILSFVIFSLCTAGWARASVFLTIAAAVAILSIPTGAHRNTRPRFTPLPRLWRRLFLAAFTIFTVLYFFSAMAPEFSPDGTAYHLSFVSQYDRAHGFVFIPMNMYAQLSQGIELLYLMAFSIGKHSAAALVHYAFLLALLLAIVSYGRRIGQPVAGLAAGLLVYLSPVVGIDGTSAYVDVAAASILFAVFYLVQLWDRQRSTKLLVIIGLLAGFGYAAKYTAFLAIPYAAGFVLWRTRRIKPALIIAACSVILMAPWMIKNALWVGNPFSPMFNAWFPNPHVHIAMEREWRANLTRYDLPSRWMIPLEVTMKGNRLCGLLGPVFLLIPFGLYGLRSREGRRVLAAGALFTIPFFANIGTRFLIPALPFYAVSLAVALTGLPRFLVALVVAHAVLAWPAVVPVYADTYPWILGRIPAKQALRIESESSWLGRKQPNYQIVGLFEDKVPPRSRIFAMSGLPEAYLTSEVWVRHQSAHAETLGDMFFTAYMDSNHPKCGQEYKFAPTTTRKIRLMQTAPRQQNTGWSIAEIRFYSEGRELPGSSAWRITSDPNPWEIPLALDDTTVTRWRTWQPFEPGMYVKVDFGSPQVLDRVLVESTTDCTLYSVRLDTMSGEGTWRTVADQPQLRELSPPLFMGMAAMREMRMRGIDYLFIRQDDVGYAELRENPGKWGLTLMGEANNGRLYRLDVPFRDDNGTTVSGR